MIALGESVLELPPTPTAAALAREFVRRCSAPIASAEIMDAVILCVSELVTNALDHGVPPYRLNIRHDADRLRIEVADASAKLPELRPTSSIAMRGRGIFLVDRMATEWGVSPTAAGKTVWAEFATS